MAELAASLLACDFARIGEEARSALDAGARILHLDIMDGAFVPNISFGASVVAAVRRVCPEATLDVHLMVNDPARYVQDFAQAGADVLTVHWEATPHLQRALALVRSLGVRAGLALNPSTPPEAIRYVLDDIDLLLLMTVNPGFGGQKLIPAMYGKIRDAVALLQGRPIPIEVDGGVSPSTAPALREAGASWLVAGSAFFGAADRAAAVRAIAGNG